MGGEWDRCKFVVIIDALSALRGDYERRHQVLKRQAGCRCISPR